MFPQVVTLFILSYCLFPPNVNHSVQPELAILSSFPIVYLINLWQTELIEFRNFLILKVPHLSLIF